MSRRYTAPWGCGLPRRFAPRNDIFDGFPVHPPLFLAQMPACGSMWASTPTKCSPLCGETVGRDHPALRNVRCCPLRSGSPLPSCRFAAIHLPHRGRQGKMGRKKQNPHGLREPCGSYKGGGLNSEKEKVPRCSLVVSLEKILQRCSVISSERFFDAIGNSLGKDFQRCLETSLGKIFDAIGDFPRKGF